MRKTKGEIRCGRRDKEKEQDKVLAAEKKQRGKKRIEVEGA